MRRWMMLRWVAAGLVVLGFSALAGAEVPVRAKYNFNPGWLVMVGDPAGADTPGFDDSGWKHVTTPYAWNEDAAFRVSIHDLPTGIAWYRKHFLLPAGSAGKKIVLEFEGARQGAEVYLNGRFIGRHEDGVMAFGMDVTDAVKAAPAENVLAVKTDNRWDYKEKATGTTYRWNNNNFYANYGGISKSVWLHVMGKVYQTLPLYSNLGTTGTYVWASGFDVPQHSATVTVETQVRNEEDAARTVAYSVRVEDMEHKVVGRMDGGVATLAPGETRTLTASEMLRGLHFWSWGYGYLYDVVTMLTIDGKTVDSVTTRTGFRKTEFGHGMIRLNDRVIQVHGYGQRTTNEWPAVGLSVPPWMSDFSNRLMVEDNANLVRWMHVTPWKQDVESADRVGLLESMPAGDAEGDSSGRHWEQRVQLMRDAILYNRNNPSILFYESGNHGISDEHMMDMKKVRDMYDPHGGRAIGAREMLASKVAEYGGEMLYINKSAGKPLWAHEYSRDEGARKFWDEFTPPFHKDEPLYNRNQDSFAVEDVARWFDYWRERPGTGTRVSSGGVNIIWSDSNTHFRGDNNYRRSGEVDAMRLPKDGFYAHKVMWDGWVDVERPAVHLFGHWNYGPDVVKSVYVVSSAEKVELKLNGRSLGFGTRSDHFLFTFDKVRFVPGTLEAVAYDAQNRVVATDALHTAGEPSALRLTLHTGPGGLRADGADMALVDVEVVDAKGERCPTALNTVRFELAGAAEWRGGIAQGPENYIQSKTLPVEGGVNRVILRSLPQAGKIVLTASADGLRPARLELSSRAVAVREGVATEMPDTGLVSYLERGPTPVGESFHVVRTVLPIVSATAGSNASATTMSYDDNETTSWASDGDAKTAWVEYSLAAPAMVGEVELKLNGFRQHRYPLRVLVDGKVAWEGVTPASLGYCTLTLKPLRGQRVRIEMTGPPEDAGLFAGGKEITGKVEASGVAPVTNAKVVLNIIEAELYEAGSASQ